MGCCYSCNKDDSAQVVTTTRMPLVLLILNVDSSFAFETVFCLNYHRHKAFPSVSRIDHVIFHEVLSANCAVVIANNVSVVVNMLTCENAIKACVCMQCSRVAKSMKGHICW